MQTNALPRFDDSVNTTGCCPKFNPDGWDAVELHFEGKQFLRATTRSAMHVPLNMAAVFTRVQSAMENAGAFDPNAFVVLSRGLSPWKAEHLFAVTRDVEDEEMTKISGDYVTRVFEGPYSQAREWYSEMEDMVRARGHEPGNIYFFYTTCPKCAKAYGRNYVIGFAEV